MNTTEAAEATQEIEIEVGCIWEGPNWKIVLMGHHTYDEDTCPHAIKINPGDDRWVNPLRPGQTARPNGTLPSKEDIEGQFLIPRVVVAYNEGGYCTTGVCLDCILESVEKLGLQRS